MSAYQVLARKYRPKNFHELIGQTHVARALTNAIDTGRLHHAYLFTGTRGVGKTTIARILAKCLNCETGITSQPCGVCQTCQAIDAGQFLDLIEIDAASRTKVEDTREILDNVSYAPVQGRYKVYLIDEVHMLSTHSFNALLKTLEEPPEYVKFIFATTDPQKLPITIISRCLQFVLRPLSQEQLAAHLQRILTLEQIDYQEQALWQLAQSAKGSVRDCLSLTDQVIAFGAGHISSDTVSAMLGLVDETDIAAILRDIYQGDKQAVAQHIATMRDKMIDAQAVLDRLIDTVHTLALLQVLPEVPLDMSGENAERLLALAAQVDAAVLQLYYEILIKSRDAMAFATTPMQALEMAILRLLAFRPLSVAEMVQPPTPLQSHSSQPQDDKLPASTDTPVVIKQCADEKCADGQNIDKTEELPQTDESNDEPIGQINQAQTPIHSQNTVNLDDKDGSDDRYDNESIDIVHTSNEQSTDDLPLTANMPLNEPKGAFVEATEMVVEAAVVVDEIHTETLQDFTLGHSPIEDAQVVEIDEVAEVVAETADRSDDLAVELAQSNEAYPQDVPMAADDLPNHPVDQPPNADAQTQVAVLQNGSVLTKQDLSARLQPSVCELVGEWSPQKWDYWLSQARAAGHFDADELALLSGGVMQGQIDGESQLFITETNPQIEASFANVRSKIAQFYPQLQLNEMLGIGQIDAHTPRQLRDEREVMVRVDAQNQLIASPVLTQLWQDGFVVQDGAPVLGQFRLAID